MGAPRFPLRVAVAALVAAGGVGVAAGAGRKAPAGAGASSPTATAPSPPPSSGLTAGDQGEDLVPPAGRDLTPLHRLANTRGAPFSPAEGEEGGQTFERYVAAVRKALDAHPHLVSEIDAGRERWAADLREALVRGYVTRAHDARMVQTLQELIAFPTVAAGGATPADIPAFQGLASHLQGLARAWGLRFRVVGKHEVVEIAIPIRPASPKAGLAILAHADVVPADPAGWRSDPFTPRVADGKVFGRGAFDDKGPLVAVLYAMKAVRDSGIPLTGPVVLVVGMQEETSWAGIRAYLRGTDLPGQVVVADGEFPVVVGENGLAFLSVFSPAGQEPAAASPGFRVLRLTAGSARNQVPGEAEAVLDPRDLNPRQVEATLRRTVATFRRDHPEVGEPELSMDRGVVTVRFRGRPAHAAMPEAGKNALASLALFLADHLGVFPDHRGRLVQFLAQAVGLDTSGRGLGLGDLHHPAMPDPTAVPTLVADGDDGVRLLLDVRWPAGFGVGQVLGRVRSRVEAYNRDSGASLTVSGEGLDPFYRNPEGDPMIAALSRTYEDTFGREGTPRTIRGTTYAKLVPGAVSLGPAAPGEGEARSHGTDEYIGVDELEALARLYAVAILRLAGKPTAPR